MPPKKGKRNRKGSKNGRRKTSAEIVSESDSLESLKQQMLDVDQEYTAVMLESQRLYAENKVLKNQIQTTRQDTEGYLKKSKKQTGKIHEAIDVLRLFEEEKVEETERNRKVILRMLEKANYKMIMSIDDKLLQCQILNKKVADMSSYKDTEQLQRRSVDDLARGLETLRQEHETEFQRIIIELIQERKSWNRLIRFDHFILSKEIKKTCKPTLDREMNKIHEHSSGLKAQLLEVTKKWMSMEVKKNRLVKVMASLNREEQYWSDLKSISCKRPFAKTDLHQSVESSESTTDVTTRMTKEEEDSNHKEFLMTLSQSSSYGMFVLNNSSFGTSRDHVATTSSSENSHTV